MNNFLFWLSRKMNFPFAGPCMLQISLTYACNLRCKMCSIVDLLPASEELSTQQVKKVMGDAKDYGIKEVLLTGGEPLLRKDIFELCAHADQLGLRSIVTTNGVLVDEAVAEQIVRARVGHVHISVEGLEATNDFFRGKGSLKKAMQAVNLLNKRRQAGRGPSIGFACTVMQDNVKELYDLFVLADESGVDVINFQPLVRDNANFMDKKVPVYWVQGEGVDILEAAIRRIRKYRPKHIFIHEEPRLELLTKYYRNELSKKDWVCFGGFKTAFVCYSKSEPLVYSCHGICGNLDKMTLKQAWRSREAYQLRRHSMNCRNLCMQSCYSLKNAESLLPLHHFKSGAR